jgi:hypothetical protein
LPAAILEENEAISPSPENEPDLALGFIPPVRTKAEKNRDKRKQYSMKKMMKKAAQVC